MNQASLIRRFGPLSGVLLLVSAIACGGGESAEESAPEKESASAPEAAAPAEPAPAAAQPAASPAPAMKPSEPIDAALETLFGLSKVTIDSKGYFEIGGWCLSPKPISAVEVTINDNLLPPTVLGILRKDVAAKHPEYKNENCGFSYHQNVAYLLKEGAAAKLRVEVLSDLGEILHTHERTVEVKD